MAFEDIAGTRSLLTDYRTGVIAAASTVRAPEFDAIPMWKPFTITGLTLVGGTGNPGGSSMNIRIWVNGVRKGLATVTLTGGAGAQLNHANGLSFTGPANSVLSLSVASVGGTAGYGQRYQVRYVHGWSR